MNAHGNAALIISILCIRSIAQTSSLPAAITEATVNRNATCIFIDCTTGEMVTPDSASADVRYTPCSTFKIWNALIGVEYHLIQTADDPFYTWDSIPRFLPAWNRDLTVKEAFAVSCVPAFQQLAREIGTERMAEWVKILNYGDMDIASGIDDFWLPHKGKKSIRISPREQAQLIKKLVAEELPFGSASQRILEEIMFIEKSSQGIYYGKTGSGAILDSPRELRIGWFVGYVTSHDRKYSFACLIKGDTVAGKDSREIIESILRKSGLL